jgi:hypothetical protein
LFPAEKNAEYQAVLGRGTVYCTKWPEGHIILGREKYSTLCTMPSREEMYFIAMIDMAYRTFLVDKNAVHNWLFSAERRCTS